MDTNDNATYRFGREGMAQLYPCSTTPVAQLTEQHAEHKGDVTFSLQLPL
jgi:hypothetical protein